jgi:hypothetical protein
VKTVSFVRQARPNRLKRGRRKGLQTRVVTSEHEGLPPKVSTGGQESMSRNIDYTKGPEAAASGLFCGSVPGRKGGLPQKIIV